MDISSKILGVVTLLYLSLFFVHLLYFATKKEGALKIAWLILYVTFGLHSVGLVARWVESYSLGYGHAPLSNYYESLIFFAWCIALILIIMRKKLNTPVITMCAALGALFFIGYASLSPSIDRRIQPLIPALQSNWLHVHVFTCFIAYASFAVSFLCGLFYLVKGRGIIPTAERLEEINYQSVMVGFPMLSAASSPGRSGPTMPGVPTGRGTPRKHGPSSRGSSMPSFSMRDLREAGRVRE